MDTRPLPLGALALLMLASAVAAQADPWPPAPPTSGSVYSFVVYDGNKLLPTDSLLDAQYTDTGGLTKRTVLAVGVGGETTLYASRPLAHINFSFDDPATPAVDAVWSGQADGGYDNRTPLRLTPVGDLAGVVMGPDGKPAPGASVTLACADGFMHSTRTGDSGIFSFAQVPAGDCLAQATASGESVNLAVQVKAGQFNQVQLHIAPLLSAWMMAAAIGILVVLAGAWLLKQKPKNKKETESAELSKHPATKTKNLLGSALSSAPATPVTPTQRQKDLLATLTPAERSIVEFVLKQMPIAVRTSKVRRALLIPKTSFTRTILALERKGFLEMKKEGGRTFLRLSGFFAKE